jgi:hypothetical protein
LRVISGSIERMVALQKAGGPAAKTFGTIGTTETFGTI